ncbi:MAG: winged helix-turn-helix domain-containing protein [Hyphomonadaceae bacterium]|nr:winged helix-turn-helix domain-containing protein [Hyphomonadaceae bacterium]
MRSNDSVATGRVDLCVRAQSVRFAGREAKLPDLSFRLLQVLSAHAPAAVSFEDIERAVWAAQVTRETMKQRAKLLRDALVALGLPEEAIAAVRSVGYRLTVPSGVYDAPVRSTVLGRLRDWRASTAAGALVVVIAAAALAAGGPWRQPPGALQIEIVQTRGRPDTDAQAVSNVSRDLANYLARMEGVDVLAAPSPSGRASDLIVDIAIAGLRADARLSLRLVDRHSGLILWAEDYPFDASDYDRSLAHFASNVHARVETLSLKLGRKGQARQPRAAREEYESILALARGAGEQELLVAQRRLEILTAQRPGFALARALRVRVTADLILRHGHDPRLAASAVAEARSLVETYPFAADFKYTLARAQMAAGDDAGALRNLHAAARDLPFLERDILTLERQIENADAGAELR